MTDPATALPGVETFGLDSARIARVLSHALTKGGDYADLYFESTISGSLFLDDGKLRGAQRAITQGAGVRVLKGDATGYAYTEDLSLAGLLRAAETASAVASGTRDEAVWTGQAVTGLDLYNVSDGLVDVDALTKLDLLRRGDAAARAYDPRISRVMVSLAESEREVLVATSDGRVAHDKLPMMRFNVQVVAVDGAQRQSGMGGGGGRMGMSYFETHSPEDLAADAARIAVTMLDAQDAPAGRLPVVLGAGDSGILLHEAVGHGLEADFNRKKTSTYSDRIGELVASEACTIVDDGTLPSSRGSINVDDEANAVSRTVLIEEGRLVGYMHDHLAAEHFGVDPTGNGRRQSYKHIPMPRMTNTSLLPGDFEPDEILESVKFGIYAKSFSGGQVNISNGDFVFSVTEGYLIEDGKVTAPVKGVNLIGNGPDAMTRVSMVGRDYALSDGRWTCGKDGQSVPVGVGIPTIKIDEITVGGSKA